MSDLGGDFGSVLLGVLLGFITILVVRIAILLTLRALFFQGFYRKNVPGANIMFVVSPIRQLQDDNTDDDVGSAVFTDEEGSVGPDFH